MTARAGFDRLIAAADAAGANPCPARGDEYRAIGLCHGGRTVGSVALHYDPAKGKAWLKCFAECDIDTVLDAFGLTRADLWDEPLHGGGAGRPRRIAGPIPAAPEPRLLEPAPIGWTPSPDTWMPKWCGHTKIAEYWYLDEAHRILFGVARCSNKCFAQWRPTPDNRHGRRWSLYEYAEDNKTVIGTVRRVPFRLPQLLAAVREQRLVHVVEGEKDGLAVVEAGGVATTIKGAGGGWRPDYSAFFTGADITIVADRDVPGRRHAQQLVDALLPVAAHVKVVIAMSGKDAHDHLAAGFGLDDFKTIWTPTRAENAE